MLPDDVIEPTAAMGEKIRVKKVVGMVEKPAVESAPSDVVATGRYLFGLRDFWRSSPYHSRQKRRTAAYRRHRSPHFRGTPRSRRGA